MKPASSYNAICDLLKNGGTEDLDNLKQEFVYLLEHEYEYGKENEISSIKTIGIFTTKEKASLVLESLMLKPGFSAFDRDNFTIGKCEIDKVSGWSEGFFNWEEESKNESK